MERHPTDFAELLFGLGFIAAGTGFVVRQLTDRTFDPAWIAAVALVTIGAAFLAVTLLHRPRVYPANRGATVFEERVDAATVPRGATGEQATERDGEGETRSGD